MDGVRRFISTKPLEIPKDQPKDRPSLKEMHSNVQKVRESASRPVTDAIDRALKGDNKITRSEWRDCWTGIKPAMTRDPMSFGFGTIDPLDVAKMESLLVRADKGEIRLDTRVKDDIKRTLERYDRDLAKGRIKAGCFVSKAGHVHQKAVCEVANVTTNSFFETMQPQAWSPNLFRPNGDPVFQRGEVRELDHYIDKNGNEVFVQHERMLLGTGKTDMDMTKVSTITVSTDPATGLKSATVEWQVYRSDPTEETNNLSDTMKWDSGFIKFEPAQKGTGMRISFHNETSSSTELAGKLDFLPDKVLDPITADSAADLGADVVAGYRAIAEGKITPVRFETSEPRVIE